MTTANVTAAAAAAAAAAPPPRSPSARQRFDLFCRGPFVRACARLGYLVKAAVYITIGLIAAMAAARAEDVRPPAGSRGAMLTILHQPFGQVLLAVVAAGLAGFALWQLTRTFRGRPTGPKAKQFGVRIMYLARAAFHAALALAAVRLLRGIGGEGDDDEHARGWTAYLMSYPFGQLLVGMVGVGIAAYGLGQIYRACKSDLSDRVWLHDLGAKTRLTVTAVCRFGIAARGVVFALIGGFLFLAAYHENPAEARGLAGALATLERQPYGPLLLAIAAGGLIAYGLYELVRARYRRVH